MHRGKSRLVAGFLLIAQLLAPTPLLAAASLLEFSLPSLRQQETVELMAFKGKFMLMTFIEPECPWCHRQMKVLNILARDCSSGVQPIVVGINGNKLALRKELRKAKVNFPAFEASKQLREAVGDVPATPWTILADPNGKVVTTLRGYIKKEKLLAVFAPYCDTKQAPH